MARLSGGLSSSADMAINNDRGRLSEEDIKRMIADGNSNRWRDEAKNDLADAVPCTLHRFELFSSQERHAIVGTEKAALSLSCFSA